MKNDSDSSASDVPDPMRLVCTLPEGSRPERRIEIQTVFEGRTAFTVHPDGVELEFGASEEIARTLLQFIFFERSCCTSFTYELGFAPPHDTVTLRLRAPEKQVASLQALYRSLTGTDQRR